MQQGLSQRNEIGVVGAHHGLELLLLELPDVVIADGVLLSPGEASVVVLGYFVGLEFDFLLHFGFELIFDLIEIQFGRQVIKLLCFELQVLNVFARLLYNVVLS